MVRRTFMSMLAAVLPIMQEKPEDKPAVAPPAMPQLPQAGQFSGCGIIVKAMPYLFCGECGNEMTFMPRNYGKEEAYVVAKCHTKHCKNHNKRVLVPFNKMTGISVEECK